MKQVIFKDLAIGAEFVFSEKTYVKINPQRINCCKSYVASLKDDPNQKIVIAPGVIVEVADES